MQIINEPVTIATAMKKRRLKLKMTLRDAARATGVMSYTQFDNMEKGKAFNPSYAVMVGLSRFLECDLNTLGRFIATSQIQAGTITTGHAIDPLKKPKHTAAHRQMLFDFLYGTENGSKPPKIK